MTTSLDISIPTSGVNIVPPAGQNEQPRIFLREIEPSEFLLVIDNTAAEKIVRCPTAGNFYTIQGREAHAKNAALVLGGSVHDGIELLLKGADAAEQDAAIWKYFQENPPPPDEYRTVQNAVKIMQHYRVVQQIRADYQWTILEDDDGPIIERAFELPLGVLEINDNIHLPKWSEPKYVHNIHVAWSGRIDLVAFCNNMNRVVDHKTTSMGGDQFIQGFQLSNQTIGYDWAAQQMWPSLFPKGYLSGFCLDAIFFKKPSGNTPLTEKGPRGGEPALQFFRTYFEYSQTRIDQWASNQLTVIEDFVHSLVRGNFPMYTAHCFNKFGRCPYYDVCTYDDNPEIRLQVPPLRCVQGRNLGSNHWQMMTTLQPIQKTETYKTNSLDEATELVKDAMRQSTFKFASVRRVLFGDYDDTKLEIVIEHEHPPL